jgi:hypothetical protein
VTNQFLALAAVAFILAGRAQADGTKAAPVKVAFEMLQQDRLISGHLAVQVKVNGKGPYRLVFDTGAPMNLLSNRIGKEAGLLGGQKPAARSTAFNYPGMVTIGKLEIGALLAEDMPAIVIDHPTIKAIGEVFGPIDGIIGFPFFAHYRTAIDYQAKELTFTPNGFKPADVMQAMMTALLGQRAKGGGPSVLAPAAQWGMQVENSTDDKPGVTVAAVYAGGAADKAGLKVGDRLLTIDGRWTDSIADCYRAADAIRAGQATEVHIQRGDEKVKLVVTPANGQ